MEVPGSGDRFNLKWNNHSLNFIQVFAEHQNAEFLVDVTLSCEGQYIKAHKLILSACSDYFHSIFQVQNMTPLSVILLNGVKFKDLKYIIQFMYHGEVKVLDADLPGVLQLGQNLQVKGLSSVKIKNNSDTVPSLPTAPVSTSTPSSNLQTNFVKIAPKVDFQSLLKNARPVRPDPVKLADPILPTEVPKVFSIINSANNTATASIKTVGNKTTSTENVEVPSNNGLAEAEPPAKKRTIEEDIKRFTESKDSQPKKENIIPPSDTALKKPSKPPNAFMIFARDWRPRLTAEFPNDSTKDISLRLGHIWKTMQPEMKKVFYIAAKKAEEEHKIEFPNDKSPAMIDGSKRKSGEMSGEISPLDPLMMVEVDEDPICISEED